MPRSHDSTCWSLIHRAADADESARRIFVERYYVVVEAYLKARWRSARNAPEIRDCIQDVFAECLRTDGVLERSGRLEQTGVRSFRRYLFGVIRNIARSYESKRNVRPEANGADEMDRVQADVESLGLAFDRAWARAVIAEAIDLQKHRAASLGEDALKRIDLLRLRFYESKPIREIARQWDRPAETLHRELSRSKDEFSSCLREVLAQQLGEDQASSERQIQLLAELLQ